MKKNQSFLLIMGSIIIGIIGFLPSLLTTIGIDFKTKLNPKYYNSKNEPLFIKDKKHWVFTQCFLFVQTSWIINVILWILFIAWETFWRA